ncbi:MAG: glycosyltransferase family 4 protein [Solirubrobacterales bacterium]
MKIAMIGHKRIPSREGGVEVVVEKLSLRMVNLGHRVDVYNRLGHHVSGEENDLKRSKNYNGIRIITIPTFQNKQLNALVYSFLAAIRATFGKYDVIHFHASGPCAMLWIPKLFGIRTVATLHGIDSTRAKWGGFASRYLRFGEKVASKYADELIVLSQNNKEYILKTYGRKAVFIPNGIDISENREADIIKNKYNLDKNEYILFLGRLVPEKGVHYLIDAYKKVSTNKKLVISGGVSHSDSYLNELKLLSEDDDRIIFTGFVQGAELEELFSNPLIYVLPSDVEGMPVSLLEAMSFGNCCLVSDIPENIEVVEDKGVSFKKGDVSDLKLKLELLLEKEQLVEEYKKNAANYILNKYNWDVIVDKTLKLYKNL